MVAHLLWILVIYGAAVTLVHVIYALGLKRKKQGFDKHYVLVTSNHERQVEWYLRALSLYSVLNGSLVRITVLDDKSQDLTKHIIRRLWGLPGIELDIRELEDPEEAAGLSLKPAAGDESCGTYDAPAERTGEASGMPVPGSPYYYIDLRMPMEAARIPYV